MSALNEWYCHIGPETNTVHQGRPYIDTGHNVHRNWPKVHKWCQIQNIKYSWNGARFNFESLDDLLYFCSVWMHEDELIEEEF